MPSDEILALTKFCDIETGLKILNSQSLRWSAPSLFDDPFEPDHETELDFSAEGMVKGAIKDAIGMLFGPQEPSGRDNKLVAAICRWRDEERFGSEDEAEVVLKQLFGQLAEQHYEKVDVYMKAWHQFSKKIRIASFSDKPDNMTAWTTLAANHSGIALKFACGDETSLPSPKRLAYTATPPEVTNLKEQVDVLFGRQQAPNNEEFILKLLQKDKALSGQKEWRCFSFDSAEDGLLYTNKPFEPAELKAVYLGLACSEEDKTAIIKVIKEKLKKTKVYQAKKAPAGYAVEFDQVATL